MTRKRAIDLAGTDGLDNKKRLRLLGIIDRLRELGISENVSLPQASESIGADHGFSLIDYSLL